MLSVASNSYREFMFTSTEKKEAILFVKESLPRNFPGLKIMCML
jgi:hypothetical protein